MLPLLALGAALLIFHEVILDLNVVQLGRITIGGFLITMLVVFIDLLTLEWVFLD
jgi:hypothetical protein